MTLNERILDFLDGTLPADDEAELLHTLSVSPEKRNMLRDFMQQRTILAQDAKSLTVPYAAEQRLWSRLGMVMPAAAEQELVPAPVPVATQGPVAGFLSRAFTGASAVVGSLTLVAGIGIGYFFGGEKTNVAQPTKIEFAAAQPQSNTGSQNINTGLQNTVVNNQPERIKKIYIRVPSAPVAAAVLPTELSQPIAANATPVGSESKAPEAPALAMVNAAPVVPISMARIGGDGVGIKPIFHEARRIPEENQTFLQRFEFRVNESFGRQFPNSAETNVSLPLITNSSVGAMFQVLPHSSLLWVGAMYGTANVTMKDLLTRPGNQIDPLQQVLQADTAHAQTSYIAGVAELRFPAFTMADLIISGGYGMATLGQMMFGEIGLHYDVSREVGFQAGFRVLRFSYDLSTKETAAINSSKGSLVVPNGVGSAPPSLNTEINTGLFFHF